MIYVILIICFVLLGAVGYLAEKEDKKRLKLLRRAVQALERIAYDEPQRREENDDPKDSPNV